MRTLPTLILSVYVLNVPANTALAQNTALPRPVSVQSMALMDVGPWGAGALPADMPALPSDLWRGADPSTLAALLTRIGPDQRFPSMQLLSRQAVFSGGIAPSSDPDLARLRFETASRLGPSEAAVRLVFAVPRLSSDEGLASVAIDAALRAGKTEDACGLIEAVPVAPQRAVWLEAVATCYAFNNEVDAANLAVDMARSKGLTDTWLSRAIAAVSGPVTNPPPFRFDSGRALALSLRAKLPPPTNLSSINDPTALSALAQNSDFMSALGVREQQNLIKNGVARGAIPLRALTDPYVVEELPAPNVLPAPQATNNAGEASLVASIQNPPDIVTPIVPIVVPPSASSQIQASMLAASSLSARALEARLGMTALKKQLLIQPGRLVQKEVTTLIEAAIWAGDIQLANTIGALSTQPIDPRLALLIALYDPTKQTQAVEQRIDAAPSDPVSRRLAMRDAMMAWSSGLPIGGGAAYLVQTGLPWASGSNGGLRAALELASDRGSKGEVGLLAALATQGIEPSNIDGETAIVAIRALHKVGLNDAARDLARDCILASFVTLAPVRPIPRSTPIGRQTTTSSTALPPPQAKALPALAPNPQTRAAVVRPIVTGPPPTIAPPQPTRSLTTPPPRPAPITPRQTLKPAWGNN